MEKISLLSFVDRRGQASAARALGVKPASVAKAIRTNRQITVTLHDDGSCEAYEVRPFPFKERVS